MSSKPYLIPGPPFHFEQEIKKSRFIVEIAHTPSIAQAKDFIAYQKTERPDARHHCSAFVAGAPTDSMQYGFSDDGEPSGTAGKPILAQLIGSGIGEITAVVTRYFGGIKLGTGGLVKAYGGSVQQALKQLPTVMKVSTQTIHFQVPFELQNVFEVSLAKFAAQIDERRYTDCLTAKVICSIQTTSELRAFLVEVSKGQIVSVSETGE